MSENYRVLDDKGELLPEAAAVLRMNIIASWPEQHVLPSDAEIAAVMEKVRVALIEGNLAMMAILGTASVRVVGKRLTYAHRPADLVQSLREAALHGLSQKK